MTAAAGGVQITWDLWVRVSYGGGVDEGRRHTMSQPRRALAMAEK